MSVRVDRLELLESMRSDVENVDDQRRGEDADVVKHVVV